MSLFPNEDILTKEETESWKAFVESLSSKEEYRGLFMNMFNDCYKYAATAINAKGEPFPAEPLIMTLLLSQHKMIDWLTKQFSTKKLLDNEKKVKESKEQQEQNLARENTNDYIRKNEGRIHYMMMNNKFLGYHHQMQIPNLVCHVH